MATVTVEFAKPGEGGHEAQELREHPIRGGGSFYLSFVLIRRPKDVGVFRISDGMGSRSAVLCDFGNCRLMN
jgi:hypothetical protein